LPEGQGGRGLDWPGPANLKAARMRLKDKTAVMIGAGQSPGEGMGNGRAVCLRFAQEGAKVLAVDNLLASAGETAAMVKQGGTGDCAASDISRV